MLQKKVTLQVIHRQKFARPGEDVPNLRKRIKRRKKNRNLKKSPKRNVSNHLNLARRSPRLRRKMQQEAWSLKLFNKWGPRWAALLRRQSTRITLKAPATEDSRGEEMTEIKGRDIMITRGVVRRRGGIKEETTTREDETDIKIKEEGPKREMQGRARRRPTYHPKLKKGKFATAFSIKENAWMKLACKSMGSGSEAELHAVLKKKASAVTG